MHDMGGCNDKIIRVLLQKLCMLRSQVRLQAKLNPVQDAQAPFIVLLQGAHGAVIFTGVKFKNNRVLRVLRIIIIHMVGKADSGKSFGNSGLHHRLRRAFTITGKMAEHMCVPVHKKTPFFHL